MHICCGQERRVVAASQLSSSPEAALLKIVFRRCLRCAGGQVLDHQCLDCCSWWLARRQLHADDCCFAPVQPPAHLHCSAEDPDQQRREPHIVLICRQVFRTWMIDCCSTHVHSSIACAGQIAFCAFVTHFPTLHPDHSIHAGLGRRSGSQFQVL